METHRPVGTMSKLFINELCMIMKEKCIYYIHIVPLHNSAGNRRRRIEKGLYWSTVPTLSQLTVKQIGTIIWDNMLRNCYEWDFDFWLLNISANNTTWAFFHDMVHPPSTVSLNRIKKVPGRLSSSISVEELEVRANNRLIKSWSYIENSVAIANAKD